MDLHNNCKAKLGYFIHDGKLKEIQTLTLLYHLTQRKINIKRETLASVNVFSIASFISMSSLLFQLHLTRGNDPIDPLLSLPRKILASLFPNMVGT